MGLKYVQKTLTKRAELQSQLFWLKFFFYASFVHTAREQSLKILLYKSLDQYFEKRQLTDSKNVSETNHWQNNS